MIGKENKQTVESNARKMRGKKEMDLRGIEPLTSRMRSEHSTPELQAQVAVKLVQFEA